MAKNPVKQAAAIVGRTAASVSADRGSPSMWATADQNAINAQLAQNYPAASTLPGGPVDDDPYGIKAQAAAQRQSASAWMQSLLTGYGLGSLAGAVDGLVTEWGSNPDVLTMKLRETQQYKDRFKGLLALQKAGNTDVRDESQYLALESSYRQVFRDAGLNDFLGTAGSQNEYDKIADLVSKYSVSVNEVKARVGDAQRVAQSTDPNVLDDFQKFYGVDASHLTAFVLDPVGTTEKINRMANAAVAAGAATSNGIGIGMNTAERIADLYGNNDLASGQLQQGLTDSKSVMDATGRLAQIDNVDLTNDDVVQSTLGINADAANKVKKLQSAERARFSGTSGTGTPSLAGNSGF